LILAQFTLIFFKNIDLVIIEAGVLLESMFAEMQQNSKESASEIKLEMEYDRNDIQNKLHGLIKRFRSLQNRLNSKESPITLWEIYNPIFF
jgi:hypothetical protein